EGGVGDRHRAARSVHSAAVPPGGVVTDNAAAQVHRAVLIVNAAAGGVRGGVVIDRAAGQVHRAGIVNAAAAFAIFPDAVVAVDRAAGQVHRPEVYQAAACSRGVAADRTVDQVHRGARRIEQSAALGEINLVG